MNSINPSAKTTEQESSRQQDTLTLENLPDIAYGIAVLGLEGMGPARLNRLKSVAEFAERKFTAIWEFISNRPSKQIAHIAGVRQDTALGWKQKAKKTELCEIYKEHSSLEIVTNLAEPESSGYPQRLINDPEPPAILFSRGCFSLSEIIANRKTVGIVGTRNCTRYGADIAYELSRQLSSSGIVVISGLALGIDFAAHSGSTEAKQADSHTAPSLAVVGNGLDIAYPQRSKKLYEAVFDCGAVISESPLHTAPQKWRFPSRNRIIAGLSDVLIVVESHLKGGSLITAEEAGIRGKTIMAVPGSIHSPASAGTNRLIADGCQPYLEIEDVFMALGFVKENTVDLVKENTEGLVKEDAEGLVKEDAGQIGQDRVKPSMSRQEQLVLDAFCWEAVSHQILLERTGIELEKLSYLLENLIQKGWIVRRGLYMERLLNPN